LVKADKSCQCSIAASRLKTIRPVLKGTVLWRMADIRQEITARLEEHDYEEAQLDAEQALLLANCAPSDNED
jgi:hypothetical protein